MEGQRVEVDEPLHMSAAAAASGFCAAVDMDIRDFTIKTLPSVGVKEGLSCLIFRAKNTQPSPSFTPTLGTVKSVSGRRSFQLPRRHF